MNKLCSFIIMLITCGICEGQNLVPNGDFEQYSGCPEGLDQFDSVSYWISPTWGTPDYFNSCDSGSNTSSGVPENYMGFQPAHGGNAYSGIIMYGWSPTIFPREYIEVLLTTTLISGSCYHFEMYINLANSMQYSTSNIAVYFSDTLISNIPNTFPLPYTPQITDNFYPFDTVNWHLFSGNYVAQGGENYLIIGNFKNDSNTFLIPFNPNANLAGSYFYIDDVSLTLCTGMNDQNDNTGISIFPNPFSDELKIKTSNEEISEIILFDIASRKLLQQKFTISVTLNSEQLAKGIYLYEVRNKNGVIKKGKVVKD